MIKLVCAFMCLLCADLAIAQQIKVMDAEEKSPVPFATVKSGESFGVTDASGVVELSNLSGRVSVRAVGYAPFSISPEALDSNHYVLFLNPVEVALDEVVVSGTKWEQKLSEVSNRIVAIGKKEIAFQNPQTAADLLGNTSEVFIQKSQLGGGSPMIRGFATNRVLLAVDGVRMNNAIFRSGNLQNVISIDPFSLGHTEVILGPGSVVYGSDALGGVMGFYTLDPEFSQDDSIEFYGSATFRGSTANKEKTGHFHFNVGWKKLALLTSISYSDYDNLKMGSNGPDDYLRPEYVSTLNGMDTILINSDPTVQIPSGYRQLNLMQKMSYKINDHLLLDYGFHYSTTSDYSRYDRLTRYRENLRSAEWYYGPQEWMLNNLRMTHHQVTGLYDRMKITFAQQHFGESRHDRDFRSEIKYNRTERVNVLSGNMDMEKQFGRSTYFYGVEVLLNKVGSEGTDENVNTGIIMPGPSRYPDGSTWNSYAVYLANTWNVTTKFTLQMGLRYNQVMVNASFDDIFYDFPFAKAEINHGALTGSVGSVYQPNDDLILKANLSTGFRSPNMDDVGKVFDSEPGSVVVPNPSLDSEYAYSADFSVTKAFGDFISVGIGGFYTYLHDAMVRRDFLLGGQDSILYDGELSQVMAIQNAAFANVYGGHARLELQYGFFELEGVINYQKGEEELEEGETAPLRHAAPVFGSIFLKYRKDGFRAEFSGIFNGSISNKDLPPGEQEKDYLYALDRNGKPYAPEWYTLNLKLQYQFKKYISLNAGIENITDQRYRPYSSGISAAGRNFMLGIKLDF